jgi:hypothetical protein
MVRMMMMTMSRWKTFFLHDSLAKNAQTVLRSELVKDNIWRRQGVQSVCGHLKISWTWTEQERVKYRSESSSLQRARRACSLGL